MNVIGIDVGSVAAALAEVSPDKHIIRLAYAFHFGDVSGTLRQLLAGSDLRAVIGVAATSVTPAFIQADRRYDHRLAVMTAARHFHQPLGTILIVGGEKFGAIFFDDRGRYYKFKTNTSCAAGTGGFLDQQARRLHLSGSGELSRLAASNSGSRPKIASRCAVFAKTDLVHAQQEGYSLTEICDGLCLGLAKNIVETLFRHEPPRGPILFTGGVSRNQAVTRHLAGLLGQEILLGEEGLHGAIGVAFRLLADREWTERGGPLNLAQMLQPSLRPRLFMHQPFILEQSVYPDFSSAGYNFQTDTGFAVEVDIYAELTAGRSYPVYLGLDVGSTSTKSLIMGTDRTVLAGFYTRTAGRPVPAAQATLAAAVDLARRTEVDLNVVGLGTTGAGRKLVGRIFGADAVVDEISAQARAARDLNPEVDTIIEIGGQDSKFTLVNNGAVTFSVMNQVCAAGTGSFIEELAERLGCPLSELSTRTIGRPGPRVSDRCTVFMERDANNFLREGYTVEEVLVAVVNAVRENYLTKVAIEGRIGRTVLFQGATAKIKTLVAAFEQRLGRPIHVSRYCHLTGALGMTLWLADLNIPHSSFRGLSVHQKDIPVKSEVCDLCPNHCKITKSELDGQTLAFGFLCGRDYQTSRRVAVNPAGFDLMAARRRAFARPSRPDHRTVPVIGIPAALHLMEDLPMWIKFFDTLGLKTITSSTCDDAMSIGKRLVGAEFCAPMTALHGHVQYLLDRADYVFLPVYLEKKTGDRNIRRQYCYYTQYAAALVAGLPAWEATRFIQPLIHYLYHGLNVRLELYRSLRAVIKPRIDLTDISRAYNQARAYKESGQRELIRTYHQEVQSRDDLHVILIGRPYSLMSPSMNKGIIDIFNRLGVKVFFQDMLPYSREDVRNIEPLLAEVHWHYGAKALEVAEATARTVGAYPVLVTSFKCTPDSFISQYFQAIMAAYDKPFLVLQLDEHDSNLGYDTRIEAAVRSFRHHFHSRAQHFSPRYSSILHPSKETHLADRTIFIPNWDDLANSLMAANFRRMGWDARVLESNPASMKQGLRLNTGQCLPLNIIAQEFIDNVTSLGLDPARTVLWIPGAKLACNIGLFPHQIKNILTANGLAAAGVYMGNLSCSDISMKLPLPTAMALMFAGLVRSMGCLIRPFEREPGLTDRVVATSKKILVEAFEGRRLKETAVAEVVSLFQGIEVHTGRRPKVAIFGDLYVRDNDIMNQGLIHFIEKYGGQVITMPHYYYLKMVSQAYCRKWFIEGQYWSMLTSEALLLALPWLEKVYYHHFEKILKRPLPTFDQSPTRVLAEYQVRLENSGESMDNLLNINYFVREHPDLALLVQTSPALCCPGLVTEAMAKEIENTIHVPVASIVYDGTEGNKNDALLPYLESA